MHVHTCDFRVREIEREKCLTTFYVAKGFYCPHDPLEKESFEMEPKLALTLRERHRWIMRTANLASLSLI